MTLELLANAGARMLLVGVSAWVALRLLRIRHPHLETLVWRMVLLASLILPVLLYWRLAPSFVTSLQLPVITASESGLEWTPVSRTSHSWLATAGSAIYLGAALLLLARLIGGLLAMWRIVRAAPRLGVEGDVRVSDRVASPATFGSVILLPPDARAWPPEKMAAVLLHERMHVRSRDAYWSWLARFHAAVFWFSPLAWYLQRRLESLAETTSDDAVVAATRDPVAYAALLLDFKRHPNSRSVVMSVAESNVSARIERLLAGTPPAVALPRAVRWSALALTIPVAIFAASSTTRAEPAAPPAATVMPGAAVAIVNAPDPDQYYPASAKAERVAGYAIVEVSLDPMGQLVDVRVVETQPADPRFGFGEAASQVARDSQFRNSTGKNAIFKFKVKFALAE
jgi:TonB family protein